MIISATGSVRDTSVLLAMKLPKTAISFVLHVHINILDSAELQKRASTAARMQIHSDEDALIAGLIQVEDMHGGPGLQVSSLSVAQARSPRLAGHSILIVRGTVSDEAALAQATKGRYQSCYFDDEWEHSDLGELVYEYLFGCNSAPSAVDMGFEYGDYHASFIADEVDAW